MSRYYLTVYGPAEDLELLKTFADRMSLATTISSLSGYTLKDLNITADEIANDLGLAATDFRFHANLAISKNETVLLVKAIYQYNTEKWGLAKSKEYVDILKVRKEKELDERNQKTTGQDS